MNIADVILTQLGGRKFIMMTGAKNLLSSEKALMFKLPSRFAKDRINYVNITLDATDLYTVTFSYVRGVSVTDVSKHSGVYAEDLQRVFTMVTGLDTHL